MFNILPPQKRLWTHRLRTTALKRASSVRAGSLPQRNACPVGTQTQGSPRLQRIEKKILPRGLREEAASKLGLQARVDTVRKSTLGPGGIGL